MTKRTKPRRQQLSDQSFRVVIQDGGAEIFIYDLIGPEYLGMVSAKMVVRALQQVGERPVTVRINSQGGEATNAIAIYNALRRHKGEVSVEIDGIAASAASYVAMAGKQIRIAANAQIMVHYASTFLYGNAADMRKVAGVLEQTDSAMVAVYAARSKLPVEDVRALLAEESWLDAEASVAKGFADEVGQATDIRIQVDPTLYRNIPERFRAPARRLSDLGIAALAEDDCRELFSRSDTFFLLGERPMPEPQSTAVAPANPPAAPPAAPVTAAAPPVVTAAAPQPVALTPERQAELEDAAASRENTRVREINALCARARQPQMAEAFIADRKTTVEMVKDKLLDALCAANPPVGADAPGEGPDKPKDPDAKFKAEYQQGAAVYARAGMSEADYVATRRIDEGIDALLPAKKAAAK